MICKSRNLFSWGLVWFRTRTPSHCFLLLNKGDNDYWFVDRNEHNFYQRTFCCFVHLYRGRWNMGVCQGVAHLWRSCVNNGPFCLVSSYSWIFNNPFRFPLIWSTHFRTDCLSRFLCSQWIFTDHFDWPSGLVIRFDFRPSLMNDVDQINMLKIKWFGLTWFYGI